MHSDLKHILIVEDDRGGMQEYILDASLHSIGRDPKCDIRLVSQFVSRRHATLVQIQDDDDGSYHYRLVDGVPKGKASANGVTVNGRKLLACDLSDHDEIVFGPQVRAIYQLREWESSRGGFEDTVIPAHYLV